ncbi:MAG: hypothetical protein GF403_05300 [Candidatus Coatesbacteria bacterium]|nr:hypothetical protein [Candidatus Coatesbacteria bacterium]
MSTDHDRALERSITRLEKAADGLAASAAELEESVGDSSSAGSSTGAGEDRFDGEFVAALREIGDGFLGRLDSGLARFADGLFGLLGSLADPGLGLIGDLLGLFGFAEGGYVDSPTLALVGEGSQPEFIIPQDKLRNALAAGRLEELLSTLAGRPVSTAAPGRVEHHSSRTTNVNHIHHAPAVGSLERLDEYSRRAAARRRRREL